VYTTGIAWVASIGNCVVAKTPDGAYSLTEIAGNLRGVEPQSPTLSINPEDWYFVK
jgi:hypothetical protein